MNETNFASYDSYFSSNLQVSFDNSLLQNMDFEIPQTPLHNYMANISCDSPLSSTSVEQCIGSCYPFLAQTRDEQERISSESITNMCATTSSGLTPSTATGAGAFANIPFVQIHTTDVQPQRTNYGNVFRRNISKQEEIKAEPIKSEGSEAAKDRTNATPTPPRAPSSSQTQADVEDMRHEEEICESNAQNETEESSVDVNGSNQLQIFKCSNCQFLALKEIDLNNHIVANHNGETDHEISKRQQINCPGCSNIFFSFESLEAHLRFDHLMSFDDATKLLSSVPNLNQNTNESQNKLDCQTTPEPKDSGASDEPLRKSRIYLKNVDCLREPNRQPFEQTENQFSEHNNSIIREDNTAPAVASKQKISIKSVDVLREPALLRRDYDLDIEGFNSFIKNNENMNKEIPLNEPTTYDEYDRSASDTLISNNSNGNNNSMSVGMESSYNSQSTEPVVKPRRPKIYVKSVESFNLMPLDLIRSSNEEFLDEHNNVCNDTPNQVYDSNAGHLPFMYESNSAPINGNGNFINSQTADIDTGFQYVNSPGLVNASYILENSLYNGVNIDDINLNEAPLNNVTLIEDQTPPPPQNLSNVREDNFNATKSPLPVHEQRGTLHLRTVDELNLMNKNEVQHLIAPHLDNNYSILSPKNDQTLGISSVDLIGDPLYDTEGFKFHDLDSQMVNAWPETYEDLEEDISGILTEVTAVNNQPQNEPSYTENSTQKNNYINVDIETPQISMITIRDIEELTGGGSLVRVEQQYISSCGSENLVAEEIANQANYTTEAQNTTENITITQDINLTLTTPSIENSENLKRELRYATPESRESPAVNATYNAEQSRPTSVLNRVSKPCSSTELPPLVPVTNLSPTSTKSATSSSSNNDVATSLSQMQLPPLIKINKAIAKPPPTSSPVEKGRIYVANNLMEPSKQPIAVTPTSGTSVRGRPYGSNRTRISHLKQMHGNNAENFFVKCTLKGCAFRFRQADTMEYHKRCHDTTSENLQATICPECKSLEFNNWNTLHTHLWRMHQIDMELYKCELCEFKTPIFSRLVNTHAKIHFDDRNYKCDQCGKGFKNSKQLKNHRRWHRVQTTNASKPKETPTPMEIHQCADCGSTFSQQKSLREHYCKNSESSLKCGTCQKVMSTKASLKLHLLTHSAGEKRYKCQQCDYATNDHNAFRRHRMTHENKKMYECQFCEYKSVQSVAYQKHVLQKHPDKADTVIHKCSDCTFSTINRSLLILHQAKHMVPAVNANVMNSNRQEQLIQTETPQRTTTTVVHKSKIKVKSNLFTTTSNDQSVSDGTGNDLNNVQLFIDINTNGIT